MRIRVLVVGMIVAAAPAAADISVDLKSADPVVGLPVIAANKLNFLRAYRRWRPNCKAADLWVESGGIDASVDEPQYTTMPLMGGCGEAIDEYAGNVSAINASMHDTQCSTASLRGDLKLKLPATFQANGWKVEVTANTTSAHVVVNRGAASGRLVGGRRQQLGIAPTEVHGWYVVDITPQQQEIAILVAGTTFDHAIAERWTEVWVQKPGKPSPVDIAKQWLLAIAMADAKARDTLTAKTWKHAGFDAASSARYGSLYDEGGFATIAASALPAEVASQQKLLAGLAHGGATLIVFQSDDASGAVTAVIAVQGGKVVGAVDVLTAK